MKIAPFAIACLLIFTGFYTFLDGYDPYLEYDLDEMNEFWDSYENHSYPKRTYPNQQSVEIADRIIASDEIYLLKNLQDDHLNKLILRGINKIEKVIPRKIIDTLVPTEDSFEKKETWVLDTVGSNLLEILSLNMIDVNRSYTNDIQEIYRVLGIEAARQAIFNEISEVLAFDSTYINYHHLNLLCDRMTCKDSMVSVFRHGINNDDIGPLAKASFEETPEMFLKAARHAELDPMRGVSANVMCGQEGFFGTSAFQVILDLKKFSEINEEQWEKNDEQDKIENAFQDIYDSTGVCSAENLQIQSNINSIEKADITIDDDYDLDF